MMKSVHTNSPRKTLTRLLTASALAAAVLVIPNGAASAAEPTLVKSLSQTQPFANDDGTFPSGATVTYEVSIGCNAPGNCDDFELHDFTPEFTDVNGAQSFYEFVSATPGGVGPSFNVDSSDPTEIVLTFPGGFSAGTSMNVEVSFIIPPGITPDNTTTTNSATWGEFNPDGTPGVNTVTDTQQVTSRARTSFDVSKTGPGTVNPNTDVEFVVSLCGDNPDDPYYGPLNGTVENATLTDQVPDGFVIVDTGGGLDNGDGTVTWQLGDVPLGPGDCIDRTITLNYPSAGPILNPINSSNTVVAGGDFPPGSDGNPGTGTAPFVIDNPSPGIPDIDKSAGRPYVDLDLNDGVAGDDGDSFSSYYLRPRNTGEGVIVDAILTDPIPDRFAVTNFDTGTWPAGPTGPGDDGLVEFVFTFDDTTTQSIFSDGTANVAFTVPDPATNPLVQLTVNYGDLPAGWIQNGGQGRSELYGYFIDPGRSGGAPIDFDVDPSVAVVNTATLAGSVIDPVSGDFVAASDSDSATVNIESPQPHPAVYKTVSATGNTFGNGVYPSNDTETTVLTWTIEVENHVTATDVYPDPVIVDVLSTLAQNSLGEGGLTAPYDFTLTAPVGVVCPATPVNGGVLANPGTGLNDSILRWECTGDLEPTESITITFKTDVKDGTPPQSVVNRDYTTTNALTDAGAGQYFSAWDGGSSFGTWQDDVDDLDNDGRVDDRIRADVASIEVLDFVVLASSKQVRGGAAAECNGDTFPPVGEDNTTYGTERCTRPGDIVDYEMVVTNDGNNDIVDLMVMDIFPAVGDSFVVPNQNTGAVSPRNSAFNTYLIGPVTSADPNVFVEYSVEQEPCRYDDLYPANAGDAEVPGCSPANWSTTPPTPISQARAIRISYVDPVSGDPAVLELGDSFSLEWPMRASVSAQTDEVATNAFGWSAKSASSDTVNTAGPPPVDISVADLDTYLLGDQVWYDENYDGTQDEAALVGVPLVPVAIFVDDNNNGVLDSADVFFQETVTDAATGTLGQYLFSGLPENNYFVAFAPPSDWVVSPAFAGADTIVDSNGTEDPTFPTTLWDPASANGALYDDIFVSDLVVLGPSNTSVNTPNDLTIDLGLWRPDPSIDVEKATNAVDTDNPVAIEDADTPTGRYIPVGEDVTWSYIVTNTGNTVLENVVVTDDAGTADPADDLSTTLGTITCPTTTLAVDASMTCTSTTTAATAGQYTNNADVVGDPVLPTIPWSDESYADLVRLDGSPFYDEFGDIIPVTDEDPSNYFGAVAAVDVEKSTNGVAADGVGSVPAGPMVPVLDAVTWTYVVTIPDPGNVPLADVVLTDDNGTPGDTTDDLSTANGDFTFVSGDTNDNDLLDVDETWTYTASAPDGAVLGIYENNADVIGTPVQPDGTPIATPDGDPMAKPTDDDPSHYYGIAEPAIDIEKSTNGIPADLPGTDPAGPEILAGSDVTWTYVIENTGNVDLDVTGFTDDRIGAISTCEEDAVSPVFPVVLSPTDSVTCTVVASNGAAIGQYVNVADVTGTPLDPDGDEITENVTPDGVTPVEPPEDDDPSNYTGIGTPGIDIVKVTDGSIWNPVTEMFDPVLADDGITVSAGKTVTWTYTVSNTGDFALADVAVNDDNGTPADDADDFSTTDSTIVYVSGDTNTNDLLDLDEVWVFEAAGTAVLGNYANGADTIGVATDPDGTPIVDQDGNDPFVDTNGDSTIVDDDPSAYVSTANPSIDIEKTTNGFQADDPAGDQSNINNTVPYIETGDQVTWQYVTTNTGDTALLVNGFSDDQIVDVSTMCAEGDVFPVTLQPGESVTCTVIGVSAVQAGDLYVNVADVVGIPVDDNGDPIVDQDGNDPYVDQADNPTVVDDDPSAYYGASPAIDLEKATNGFDADTGTGPFVAQGGQVTWTYVVTNTGNTDLADLTITDSVEGQICTIDFLAIGDDATCERVIDESTLVGQYENGSTVTGQPVDQFGEPVVDPVTGDSVAPIGDSDPSHYFGAVPGIDIEKATNGVDADTGTGPYIAQGDIVTWTYVVTNTGNVALTDIVVTDDVLGEICTIPLLLAGAEQTCSFVAAADTVGQYENNSDVVGTPSFPVDPDGDPTDPDNYDPIVDPETGDPIPDVDDEDPSHYFGVDPSVDIEKYTNGIDADQPGTGPVVDEGADVTWRYVVTNTGDVALIDLVVTDDLEGEICVIPLLLPGESEICNAVGVGERSDYRNVGTVTGTPATPVDPDGDPSDPDNYEPIDTDPVTDDDPSGYTPGRVLDDTGDADPDPTPTPVPPPPTGPDVLPTTGSTGISPMLIVGLGLLIGGLVLTASTRRRRRLTGEASGHLVP